MPPYPFGKGPIASAFETYVATRKDALDMLKTAWKEPLGRNAGLRKLLAADDEKHLDDVLYPKPDTPEAKNRRKVVRNGIRQALMIALGVGDKVAKPTDKDITRDPPWPIEFFWGCGASVDQCWVSSRPQPGDTERGQVTIMLQFAMAAMPAPRMTPRPATHAKATAKKAAAKRELFVYRQTSRGGAWVTPDRGITYVRPAAKKASRPK
jgi:hypothetical protein